MDDLIDRQQAIDALWAERMKLSEEMERNLETCSFALRADNKARRNRVEEDIEIIKQLPPAQPEELDTLIKALEAEHKKLREMQKAQPEIIRCKDCAHYDGQWCYWNGHYLKDNDFCSRAERIKGDAE